MTDSQNEIWETFEKQKLTWDVFNVRYRTIHLMPVHTRREHEWLVEAAIFLTSSDPSIGLPEVKTGCPHYPSCGCGTQSGPHTCVWPSGW